MSKWEIKKLGKIAEKITKGTTPTTNGYKYQKKGIGFVKVENLNKNEIDTKSIEFFISDEAHKAQSRSILKVDDLLFSIAGTIGKIALVKNEDLPLNTNQALAIIRGYKDYITPDFLRFTLTSKVLEETKRKARGGALQNISLTDLKETEIPLPPLPEQQRIVTKLDGLFEKIDKAISLLEENIEDTQALMGSVLDEEFGKLNCDWFMLKDITEIVGGGTPKTTISEYWADEIIWLSPTDLPPIGVISKVNNSNKKISKLGLQKSSAKLLPKGTVVFSSRASIGKIGITECELATNQGFTNFIPNEGVDNMYLAKTLKHYTPKIEALSNSTTFKEVNKKSLKSFKVPLPIIETQLKLSKLFSEYQKNIDKTVSLQTQKLDHLKALKSSLLDQAFKGEL
ncbi:restriction endonuclease subunit S [Psychroflexus sp. CAK57W]|uniref:restriction endonuclease subunit S n=1 Tax=Psychroflexus curvus TaxID=2873595 RepID=UPI001CCBA5DD|nr:restriction endonuclease subunit S [Psychroflexus curvus]MBZ9786430.1 restriction endonuclease subunit S [Psychroflexus curvus]